MKQTQKFILNCNRENMIKSILPVLFFFFIVLTTSLVAADKVVTTTVGQGLQVNTWTIDAIPFNTNFTFVWDVSSSVGTLLKANTTNCSFITYPSGILMKQVSGPATITPDGNAWFFTVNGNNYTTAQLWNYQIDCNLVSNTSISGNALDSYDVTATGRHFDIDNIDNRTKFSFLVFFFTLAGILIIFGIMKGDSNMSMFGTFVLFLLSLYTLINGFGIYDNAYTNMFSLILVGLSVYIAAKCMEDWLSNLNKL